MLLRTFVYKLRVYFYVFNLCHFGLKHVPTGTPIWLLESKDGRFLSGGRNPRGTCHVAELAKGEKKPWSMQLGSILGKVS